MTRSTIPILAKAAIAILAFTTDTQAQEKPPCEQFEWSVNRELASFSAPDLQTVESGASLPAFPDRAFSLKLQPNDKVPFAMPPGHKPKADNSSGGLVSFSDVHPAGSYQITLSNEAWIDIIQDGRAVRSSAHTGKRDCPQVRKSVRFELQSGPAVLQVSGVLTDSIKVAILPVP